MNEIVVIQSNGCISLTFKLNQIKLPDIGTLYKDYTIYFSALKCSGYDFFFINLPLLLMFYEFPSF